jgi:acyl-coenzyme A synthetase/AMP-(fatty) acid ligase
MITPIPNAWELEAGSAALPFFGIETQLLNKSTRQLLQALDQGEFCIRDFCPDQARNRYRSHEQSVNVYFKHKIRTTLVRLNTKNTLNRSNTSTTNRTLISNLINTFFTTT